MTWFLYTLIGVLLLSFSRILQRYLLRENNSDPALYAVAYQYVVAFVIFIYALVRGFNLSGYENYIPQIALMSILYVFGNIFMFKAFKLAEAGIVTVVFSSSSIWSILSAIILLNESLNIFQVIGIFLLLSSVIYIGFEKFNIKKLKNKGVIYAVISALFFGFAFTNDALIIGDRNLPSYLSIAFFLPGTLLLLINISRLRLYKSTVNSIVLPKIFVLGVLYALSSIFIYSALQAGGHTSIISPLQQSSTIITILLAIPILKENKDIKKKLFSAILAILGVILCLAEF